MKGALATVTICWNPVEAGFVRDQFEQRGIKAFVRDSNLATVDPMVTPALGGIRVDVEAGNVERAREILKELRAARPAVVEEGPWIEDDDCCPACRKYLPDDSDDCPSCGWTCGKKGAGDGSEE